MRLIILTLSLTCIQCSQKPKVESNVFDAINDNELRGVIERAYQKAGGLEKWKSIDTLSFMKKSVLYSEDGSIESEVIQHQLFVFRPYFQAALTWVKDSTEHRHVYDGKKSTKFENQQRISQMDGAHASILSASYVISMPYELLKDAELLSSEGSTFLDSTSLQVVKVNYKETDVTNDTWWYFFDQEGNYWGSKVYHKPTYALIENTSMDKSTGLTFPSYRRSYRVDSLDNKEFLRAEFWYSDYKIASTF